MQNPKQSKTLHVETLNNELSVYDWQRQQMHSLNPTAAQVFALCDGKNSPAQMGIRLAMPKAAILQALGELNKAHLLDAPAEKTSWHEQSVSRRQFLKAGSAVAAAAVVSIMLPSPAAAQSAPPPPAGSIVRTAVVGTAPNMANHWAALNAPITDAEITALTLTQITFAWSSGVAPTNAFNIFLDGSNNGTLLANTFNTISVGSNSPQTFTDANAWTGNRPYNYLLVFSGLPGTWNVGTMTITLS
ncbi:MAG: twin-arginine translocation signal domain-containing protein [Anaerolineae bacterium]|nr:twin-arginine translocation signal domain-containing protein [Anaerolineae bacterium]